MLLVGACLTLRSRSLELGGLDRVLTGGVVLSRRIFVLLCVSTRAGDLSVLRDISVELRVRTDGDTLVSLRVLEVSTVILPELDRVAAGDGRL